MPSTFADELPDKQRMERAAELMPRLVDHTRGLVAAAENNSIVLYTDRLSSQMPRSFAANAFNELQRSMHFYFLVRLGALWDKQSSDRESLPSLFALVDKPSIRELFADQTYQYYARAAEPRDLTPTDDLEDQRIRTEHWEKNRLYRARKEKAKVERWLNFAVRIIPRVEQTFVAPRLRPFRDSYIAHNLNAAVASKSSPLKLNYGDEAKLFRLTVRIVDRLYLAINGTSFAWDSAREQSNRNANELWSSCRFEFPH